MKYPNAVLFDFDGIIVNSEPLYEKVERKVLEAHDIYIDPDEWDQFKGISSKSFFILLSKKYGSKIHIPDIKTEMKKELLTIFKEELEYVVGFLELFSTIQNDFSIFSILMNEVH